MAYTTIKKPSDYFEPIIFTASNASSNTVSGMGFQPDLIWWKNREQTYPHFLYDVIRGNTKQLASNTTGTEETRDSTYLTSFNSDGFTTGTALAGDTSDGIASWNWLANGAGSANTDGSISSTVSANTTSGFSIVSYTATGSTATIGHGLGAIPKMMIIKNTISDSTWAVYNASLGTGKFLRLQGTDAVGTEANWFDTTPTSSVFTVGSNLPSGATIAYCFADVQGFSKFGSYIGNGNADGTFIYTGFSPAFIITKPTSTTGQWTMFDNKRDPANVGNKKYLHPNTSGDEGDANSFDFLSNGFKLKLSGGDINTSGTSYIYMAFAEEPLVGDNPATAR